MTLSKEQIVERINTKSINERLIVTPILDWESQIGPCGIDVRLGKQFIVFNENSRDGFSAGKVDAQSISSYYEEIILSLGQSIVIHPGKVIIASTLEYVSIPTNLECQVEGRSSWARLGLVIATASTVEPGYKGVVTLELSNVGKIPITLYPGLRIAQLLFHTLSQTTEDIYKDHEKKKYSCNIGPRISKILDDKDISYFANRK